MTTVDARNKPCPEPVLLTKKALEAGTEETVTVIVDNETSLQNVTGFAQSRGCAVKVTENDGLYSIEITRAGSASKTEEKTGGGVKEGTGGAGVLLITGDLMGSGDEELGRVLMTAFINTLPESKQLPEKMLFVNRGVMLTTEGSAVLDTLGKLEASGVRIFSCGTCLNFYNLKEKLAVGKVTNMYDTVDSLLTASKVVRI